MPLFKADGERLSRLHEDSTRADKGWWNNFDKYIVSLLKAYYGESATAENDFGFDWLPRVTGDHSHLGYWLDMADGKIEGMFVMGQNPAVGAPNSRLRAQGAGQAEVAGRAGHGRDRDGVLLVRLAGDRARRTEDRRHRQPKCSSFLPRATRKRRAASRTRSACFNCTKKPSTRRATRAAKPGSSTTSARRLKDRARRGSASAQRRLERADLGLPDRRDATTSPTSKRCCRRSTGYTSPTASW